MSLRCGREYCFLDQICCGPPSAEYCCWDQEIEVSSPPVIIITTVSIGSLLLFLGVTALLIRCLCKKRPTAGRMMGARVQPINDKTYPTNTAYPQGHIVPPPNVQQGGMTQTRPVIGQHTAYNSTTYPPGHGEAPYPHQMQVIQSAEPPKYQEVTAGPHDRGLRRENASLEVSYPPGHVPPPFDYKPPFAPPEWQMYN
ncbi:uncharacterized protein LOC125653305 [Ostrea edulis]|uniref:uncharacterized protein LOC125653305 n=1 Tax=Ostrea edulis TaxID=37623 RepID=UPI0024AF417B|nr:uncharacterized protein LOC125653305 [Ostrea edulis]